MTVLRAARSTDAGAVGAILSAFIDDTPWMPRIHTRAEDLSFAGSMIERGWVTVAQIDGAVVGFAALNGAELNALYIAKGHRNRRIGAQLLDDAKAETPRIELWTFQANEGAQRFYTAHGFEEVERTNGADNDEKLPDIRYTWERS